MVKAESLAVAGLEAFFEVHTRDSSEDCRLVLTVKGSEAFRSVS